jgi:hypothetical protein
MEESHAEPPHLGRNEIYDEKGDNTGMETALDASHCFERTSSGDRSHEEGSTLTRLVQKGRRRLGLEKARPLFKSEGPTINFRQEQPSNSGLRKERL